MLGDPWGRPASLLGTVLLLLLSVLLGPPSSVTQELGPPSSVTQELGPPSSVTQEQPDGPPAPSLNLKFDPRTWTLSWSCQENATNVRCWMNHKDKGDIGVRPRSGDCHCTFGSLPLHGGVTLKVRVTLDQGTLEEELVYANPGAEGTAAQDFSCVIYSADFMNCTWTRGPAAPSDVQYFLYIGDSKRKRETECPQYIPDVGTHGACHLRDLSRLRFYNFFLVNGTSRATEIQFLDSIWTVKEIEQISPPDNISVQCNSSGCLVQWSQPRTKASLSDLDFQYQLGIQTQNSEADHDRSLIDVSGQVRNLYHLPSPGPRARRSLRIRAADSRRGHWGDWSPPVEFGPQGQEGRLLHVYLLGVLGTVVCALLLGLLLHRFQGLSRLFPPIPQVKDKVSPGDQVDRQMDWAHLAAGAGKEDLEDIVTVEEMS